MSQQKVKDGYAALNSENWPAVEAVLDPNVVFHVEGRDADYVGRPAVMAFLQNLVAVVGGGSKINFLRHHRRDGSRQTGGLRRPDQDRRPQPARRPHLRRFFPVRQQPHRRGLDLPR
jgi:ribosomal protein L21